MSRILFGSDIDGTLLNKGNLPKQNVEAINRFRSKGNKFCVVTGRDLGMIPKEITDLCDYFVTINGAAVFDGQRNPIYLQPFSKEKYQKIHNIVYPSDTQKLWIHSDTCYYEELRDGSKNTTPKSIYANYVSYEEIFKHDIYQISFDYEQSRIDYFEPIFQSLRDLGGATVYVSKGGCDVMPSNCSKAKGLKILQDTFNFDLAYAIGDGGNDIEMIEQFKSFAMETGEQRVKEKATYIVSSVAQAIEQIENDL